MRRVLGLSASLFLSTSFSGMIACFIRQGENEALYAFESLIFLRKGYEKKWL